MPDPNPPSGETALSISSIFQMFNRVLKPDTCTFDMQAERLVLGSELVPGTRFGISIQPSEDHRSVDWQIDCNGESIDFTEEEKIIHTRSPLTNATSLYFGFLRTGSALVSLEYDKGEDQPNSKFIVVGFPEADKQIRFSMQVDNTLHGKVILEPSGTKMKQQQIRLSALA